MSQLDEPPSFLFFALKDDIKHPDLKTLSIHSLLFHRDSILLPVHGVTLSRVILKMNLGHQRFIPWANSYQMKMGATPKLRRACRVRPVRNRPDTLQLVVARLRSVSYTHL